MKRTRLHRKLIPICSNAKCRSTDISLLTTKTGRVNSHCRPCNAKATREYNSKNYEKVLERNRKHRIENREHYRAMSKRNREKHRDKINARSRKYYKEVYRQKQLDYQRHHNTGCTKEQFDHLVKIQCGRCAICRRIPKKMCVDHDHKTGKLRGMLCVTCNSAVGFLMDSEMIMRQAIEYIRVHSGSKIT